MNIRRLWMWLKVPLMIYKIRLDIQENKLEMHGYYFYIAMHL